MSFPDSFRLKNCIYLSFKHTGQYIFFLIEPLQRSSSQSLSKNWGKNSKIFLNWKELKHFHSEHCNYLFKKDYWTTNIFLVDPLKHSNPRSLSKPQQKMHKNIENCNILKTFVLFGVNLKHFQCENCNKLFGKPTGQHISSFLFLTVSNVPIYKVCQKFV